MMENTFGDVDEPHPISGRLQEQSLRCLEEEDSLPQDGSIESCLSRQPAGLPCRFWTCQPHHQMSQFLKTPLSPVGPACLGAP